jgi:hypothetical protein
VVIKKEGRLNARRAFMWFRLNHRNFTDVTVLVTLFIVMILIWQLVPSPRVGLRGSSLRSKPASIEERLDPTILDSSI